MQIILEIFGSGYDLNAWQMCIRAIVVFLFAIALMRISGRRSFGLQAPFDNIILILLGAILSRAVVGASPFLPTLAAGLSLSVLHRIFAILTVRHSAFSSFIKGQKISLYQDGKLYPKNLKRGLVSEEDMMQEVRLRALVDNLDDIKSIHMERNGKISTVKK